jgi:hypothetical protein
MAIAPVRVLMNLREKTCSAVVHELAAHNRTMKIGAIKSKPATFEVVALVLRCVFDCSAAEPPKPAAIRRLDGTTIATAEAESFARKTLDAAHVTGAQIAVLDDGLLV